jgi:hypothetical protein
MSLDECVHSAPLRLCAKIRRAGGSAVNWRRHYDLAQRHRGAELFAMKELFRGRCPLMNAFTLSHCASARKYVVLGVVRDFL